MVLTEKEKKFNRKLAIKKYYDTNKEKMKEYQRKNKDKFAKIKITFHNTQGEINR